MGFTSQPIGSDQLVALAGLRKDYSLWLARAKIPDFGLLNGGVSEWYSLDAVANP